MESKCRYCGGSILQHLRNCPKIYSIIKKNNSIQMLKKNILENRQMFLLEDMDTQKSMWVFYQTDHPYLLTLSLYHLFEPIQPSYLFPPYACYIILYNES